MTREQIEKNSYGVMMSRIETLIATVQPLGFNSEADAAALEAKHDIISLVQEMKSKQHQRRRHGCWNSF